MSRTVVSAEIGVSEDSFVGATILNNDARSRRLSFIRTISPRLSFGLDHQVIERDFGDGGTAQPDGKDSAGSIWLTRQLGRRFSVAFAWSQYDRTGVQSYDERRYEIRFGYSPTDSGPTAMQSVGR
jgi:hypothetical protein